MAIELNYFPENYSSAHGDLVYVVHEATKAYDDTTYPDYKYVADVYVNSVLVTRLKRSPSPDNKRGVFNIGPVVRNYVSSVFNPTAGQLRAQQSGANEFNILVQVFFGEEYDFTLYDDLLTTSRTFFNHYNGRITGTTTALADYVDKALTVRPYATPVNDDDSFCFVPFFPTDMDNVTLSIKSYSDDGTLLNTITQAFTPSSIHVLQLFNIAPAVLNSVSAGFISDSVKYYTVEFQTPNISTDSLYRFDLTCEAKYEVFTLHFLNRFGGFESRNFTKVSRKKISIEKKDFGKLAYTVDASGNVGYYNPNKVYNETKSTFSSLFSEKLTLNTDILTDEEYNWMADLILSPLVYLEENDYFIPVNISATDYEFRKVINDKLTNLTIELDFGNQLNAQYR